MPHDINEWQLDYGSTSFQFGYRGDGTGRYPLAVQVEIGDADRSTQDYPQPSSDGVVMGYERLGGMLLTLTCRIVRDPTVSGDKWVDPLDLVSSFKAKWRADSVRSVPGNYATLSNLSRERMVIGRPRRCAPTYSRIRKGGADLIADFATITPEFYDTTEEHVHLTPSSHTGAALHDGDLPSWPLIKMRGPGTSTLALKRTSDNSTVWTFTTPPFAVPDNSYSGPSLVLDSRPWHRSLAVFGALGSPDNSHPITTATNLDALAIPVGDYYFDFSTDSVDIVHIPNVDIYWRKAYGSL